MLSNVLRVLLRLCDPFLIIGHAKAEALANKTDLDYFHGSDRCRILLIDRGHLFSTSASDDEQCRWRIMRMI